MGLLVCESGNGSSGSLKCGEFPDEVINYWRLNKNCAL